MRYRVILPALALAFLVAACDQGSGTGPAGTGGDTRFLISQTGSSGALGSLIALDDGGGGGGHGNSIALSAVKSIIVHVTGVAALPLGNDSIQDRDWVHLTAKPIWLNLLALPLKADSGIQVTRGNLPAGTYGDLRLLFDSATITFAQTVTAGHGNNVRTFHADSTYPLVLGGFNMPDSASDKDNDDANHFGIVVRGTTFTIAKDTASTVAIVFNPGQSLQRVIVTGKGLRIQPVIGSAKEPESAADDSAEAGKGNGHGNGGHGND